MKGWTGIGLTLITTVLLWWAAKSETGMVGTATATAQLTGLLGMMLLCWTILLAARHRAGERLFGGLDKVYRAHQVLGGSAFVLLLNHPLLLMLAAWPANTARTYLWPGANWGYNLGQAALYLMSGLLVLTLYWRLPYRFWKWTHEWMGWVVVLGGLHSFLIVSDTSRYLPLRYWVLGWSALATAAYLYKRYLYYVWQKPGPYQITRIGRHQDMVVLSMASQGVGIEFEPGQFGFFSFPVAPRDEHPFSIMASGRRGLIVAAKRVGKFTEQLAMTSVGALVYVRGPYGMFGEKMREATHAVWVAGGIGITPFISMARAIGSGQRVELYFSARVMPHSVLTETFGQLSERNPQFKWCARTTSEGKRISARQIYEETGRDRHAHYLLCGPKVMMETMALQLAELGVRRSRIIYEDFAFR